MDTQELAFEDLARSFLGRASVAAEGEMGDSFDPRVLSSIDLAIHGEGLIGLENLCSNLCDYEIGVSDSERSALFCFADVWLLSEHYRGLVNVLSPR